MTKVGDEVQVAFTNPVYMAAGYRLTADLAPVAARLAQALGSVDAPVVPCPSPQLVGRTGAAADALPPLGAVSTA